MRLSPSRAAEAVPRPAIRVEGHLGEFLQGRLGPSGPLALVTLPCPTLAAEVVWHPGRLRLEQPGARVIGLPGLRGLLAAAGAEARGRFRLTLEMPVGGGAGASTAARVALLRATGVTEAPVLARACLSSEGASDPLMFADPARMLWASREGRVLGQLPPLPVLDVLGGFYGPSRRTEPLDMHFPDISDLLTGLDGTLDALARAAAESAARTLALRGPGDDPTPALAARLGAAGWAIGHTGPARALIFPPGGMPPGAFGMLRRAGFSHITRFRIGGAPPA